LEPKQYEAVKHPYQYRRAGRGDDEPRQSCLEVNREQDAT
jgi:hypothetical protein